MNFLKIVLILLFSSSICEVYSQHYLGVSGGYGGGIVRMFPYTETGPMLGLYSGGVSYKYYGETKYVGGIGSDLVFLQQGYTEEIPDFSISDTTRTLNRKVNSLMLPFFWQPHVNLFSGKMRVFVNLGAVVSYNISSSYEVESEQNGFIASGQYDMLPVRDNRWGYGLCGGVGFNVVAGRFEIGVEGRYYFGYNDILKNYTQYELNPLRSPMDNVNISMSLHYRLGWGDKKRELKNKIQ